jgi:glutamyl-tRNA synthetase
MSKRDSGKEFDGRRFDPDVATYREAGYFREALVNYIMLLGWNPGEGDERQVFDFDELIQEFSLERVSKAKAIFDLTKLQWINSQHLKNKTTHDLLILLYPVLKEKNITPPDETYLLKVIELLKERVKFVHEFVTVGHYFFCDPTDYDQKGLKKYWKEGSAELLMEFTERIEVATKYDQESLENVVRDLSVKRDIGAGKIIHPTRLAVSGTSVGPGLFELLEVLGKEIVVRRIRCAVKELK